MRMQDCERCEKGAMLRTDHASVLLGCSLVQLAGAPGHNVGVNAFVESWILELGLTRTQVSVDWLVASASSAVAVPVAGLALDSHGAVRTSIVAAPLLVGVLLLLGRATTSLELVIELSALRFLGAECLVLVATTTICRWFVRRRGLALGFLGFSTLLIQSMPPQVTLLIDAVGWRAAYVVLAFLVALLATLGIVLLRDHPANDDGDAAAQPLGPAPAAKPAAPLLPADSLQRAVQYPMFWVVAAVQAVAGLFYAGLNFHFVSFVGSLGGELASLSKLEVASAVFLPIAATMQTSRFLTFFLVLDHLSPRRLLLLTALTYGLTAVLALACLQLRSTYLLELWASAYGATRGMSAALASVLNVSLYGTEALGVINGASTGIAVAASGLGPVLFSLAYDYVGSYAPCVQAGSVCQLVLALVMARLAFRTGGGGGGAGGGARALV